VDILNTLRSSDIPVNNMPMCPPCITAVMTQDSSVRVRRAAFKLWMVFHNLFPVKDCVSETVTKQFARGYPEERELRQLVERLQDKCAAYFLDSEICIA
jgi:hypothetical protein